MMLFEHIKVQYIFSDKKAEIKDYSLYFECDARKTFSFKEPPTLGEFELAVASNMRYCNIMHYLVPITGNMVLIAIDYLDLFLDSQTWEI